MKADSHTQSPRGTWTQREWVKGAASGEWGYGQLGGPGSDSYAEVLFI
jgi:hypothetical protein